MRGHEQTILHEAAEIVDGARQTAYGHPRENHACTGEMWTSYLQRRGILAEGAALDARDVCILNILQKTSREANTRKRDNLVDIAGFARNAEMVSEEEEDLVYFSPEFKRVREIISKAIVDFTMREGERPTAIAQNDLWLDGITALFGIPVFENFNVPQGRVTLSLRGTYQIVDIRP